MRWVLGLMAAALVAVAVGEARAQDDKNPVWAMIDEANDLAPKNPKAALAVARKAAATGHPEGLNLLGVFTYQGIGMPADPAGGLKLYRQAVAKGSKGARLNLATVLLSDDEDRNDREAVEALKPVMDDPQVGPVAAYPMGRAKLFGLGGPRDMKGGLELLETAAKYDQANGDANFLVGRGYAEGWGGFPQDPAKATSYFRRSAEAGDERGQWYYAMALLDGLGVEPNAREAWRWVRRSAEQGYRPGMVSAAVMLATGQGVAENDPEARRWYEKAALAGSTHALATLGAMLMIGEGGDIDRITAQAYLELAAQAGSEKGASFISQFGFKPTAEQRQAIEGVKASWRIKGAKLEADG